MKINSIGVVLLNGILRFGVVKKITTVETNTGTDRKVTLRLSVANARPVEGLDVEFSDYLVDLADTITAEQIFAKVDNSEDRTRAIKAAELLAKGEDPDDLPF